MYQLVFPFISAWGRTLPPREITSIGDINDYRLNHQLALKFYRRKAGFSRLKRELFGDKKVMSCFYCSDSLCFNKATVEHLIPRCKGGTHNRANLAISCAPCNSSRPMNSTAEEWKSIVVSKKNKSAYIKLYNYLKKSERLIERKYLK